MERIAFGYRVGVDLLYIEGYVPMLFGQLGFDDDVHLVHLSMTRFICFIVR